MLSHLHTHDTAPLEYTRMVLMREFGWTPSELRAIPLPELLEIMTCMRAEVEHRNRPKGKKVNAA